MTNDEIRQTCLDIIKWYEGKESSSMNLKLARETLRLLDRPPMACLTCEELNLELANELDSVRRWEAYEERKALALNAWLEASGANDFDPKTITDEDLKKHMSGDTEKHREECKKFEAWWENNKFFQ